jgi:hypothetical protein
VTVVDTLDTKIPVYEFQMAGASHPYKVSHHNNVVTWVFDNIYLKPKSLNEEKSKGFLVFDAKVNGSLAIGDSITNRANIYFDFNDPIITNFAIISRVDDIDEVKVIESKTYTVYPNPTNGIVHIANIRGTVSSFELYDHQGKLMHTFLKESLNEFKFDITTLQSGLYFLKDNHGYCVKLIKL